MERNCNCNNRSYRVGAIESVFGTLNSCNNCRRSGNNGCGNCNNGCNNGSTMPTTCAGYPLYYNGTCPGANSACPGICASCGNCQYYADEYVRASGNGNCNCNGCNNGCGNCNGCNGCGNWNGNGCNNGCGNCNCCCGGDNGGGDGDNGNGGNAMVDWATFIANAPVSVSDGGSIPLTLSGGEGDIFTLNGTSLTFNQSGLYHVMFTVNVPAGRQVASRVAPAINGDRIFAGETEVVTDGSEFSGNFTGFVIVRVTAGQTITLKTYGALSIPSTTGTEPAVVLTVYRLGN